MLLASVRIYIFALLVRSGAFVLDQLIYQAILTAERDMSLVFKLPEVPQTYILSQWLQTSDLHTLDDALLGERKLHIEYRALLQSPTFVIPFSAFDEHKMGTLGWIIDRKLKFGTIELNSYTFEDSFVRSNLLSNTGQALEKISVTMRVDYEYDDYRGFDIGNQLSGIMNEVAMFCPRLQEFSVRSLAGKSEQPVYTDDSWDCLVRLLESCTNLQVLSLRRSSHVNSAVLTAICKAPNLVEVDLTDCVFRPGSQPELTNTTVKTLHCTGTELTDYLLTDDADVSIFEMFPNLRTISASISSDELQVLCIACPLLRMAHITVNDTINNSEILLFAQALPYLEALQLRNIAGASCDALAVVLLVEHCANLLYLNLSSESQQNRSNIAFTDTKQYVSQYGGSRLRELYVDSMTEHILCTVIRLCPNLHTLGTIHSEEYSPDTVDDAYTVRTVYTPHNRPAELALRHINNSSIKSLHLCNYTHLADAHILPLCTLEEIHISYVGTHFTHNAVTSLGSRCAELKAVCIKACDGVNYTFILPLLQQCPALHTLQYRVRDSDDDQSVQSAGCGSTSPVNIMLTEMVKKFYPNIRNFDVHC